MRVPEHHRLLSVFVALLLPLFSHAKSSGPQLFCKCTCPPHNSTIIPTTSCAACNRQFCLDYNLPSCKAAKEEEVFTTCFQRDSLKDQTVVCLFIAATVGLLLWALVRPWARQWLEKARRQQGAGAGVGYQPVSAGDR